MLVATCDCGERYYTLDNKPFDARTRIVMCPECMRAAELPPWVDPSLNLVAKPSWRRLPA